MGPSRPASHLEYSPMSLSHNNSSTPSPGRRESRNSIAALPIPPDTHQSTGADDQLVSARQNLAIPGQHYIITAPPQSHAYPQSATHFSGCLPEDFSSSSSAILGQNNNTDAETGAWPQLGLIDQKPEEPGFSNIPTQPSRELATRTPRIKVTTHHSPSAQFSQPQAYVTSSASTLPPESNYFYQNQYSDGRLSPNPTPYMPHETELMQAPIAELSGHDTPHDPALGDPQMQQQAPQQEMHELAPPEQQTHSQYDPPQQHEQPYQPRKRSHSEMSQQEGALQQALQEHARAESVHSPNGVSPTDDYSPRGSRAFKRGDPPVNAQGKYICEYSEECIGQVFDRKCEWR